MTANRRQFTFGALLLAVAGPARAAGLEDLKKPGKKALPQQQAASPDPEVTPDLHIAIEPRIEGEYLHLTVSVQNRGEPLDVMVAMGSRPGPTLTAIATIDDEALPLGDATEFDRREMMSRLGPRPEFAPLARGGTLQIKPYRLMWPKGVEQVPVAITVQVHTSAGPVTVEHSLAWTDSPAT